MLSWLAGRVLSYNMARLREGDPRAILRMDAKDVTMRFPGQSTWATEVHGKQEHERWLRRFARVGIQIFPDEVVVKGFPWRMTICVRGHDYLKSDDGATVYENRYVIWGRLAWGLLKEYEVYEDTQKAAELDDWLRVNERLALAS